VQAVFSSENQESNQQLAGVEVSYSDLNRINRDTLGRAKVISMFPKLPQISFTTLGNRAVRNHP